MKILLQIICVVHIVFVSCNKEKENKGEIENQNRIQKLSIEKVKSIKETVLEPIDEPSESMRIKYYAQMILDNKVQPSDNDETFEVIDQLFVENQNDLDFYFEVFRVIVDKSDGALSEVVGQYIMSFLKLYPDFFISKYSEFEESEKMKYVYQLSFEFYYSNGNYKMEIINFFEKVTNRLISKSESQIEMLEEINIIVLKETERILEE
jgi:hypothetical protein